MATKRVYYIENNKIKFKDFGFIWCGGFSKSQKEKNITKLHDLISDYFNIEKTKILEVSTKSNIELGKSLSSFNLHLTFDEQSFPLECLYQSSKVFRNILGEYQIIEALKMNPGEAKKRLSIENHNNLIKFRCLNREFPLNPSYLFYDWLYINAVKNEIKNNDTLLNYEYFTDIEFNQKKSHNCQARSLTLYKWLLLNKRLDEYINNPLIFYKNIK